MTHIPVQLPFKGFTEQAQFSALPPAMTPSCLNMMPSDVWNGRTRISTRNGTRLYNTGVVQFMGSYRIYEGTTFVEKVIVVRSGVIYRSDPHSDLPATPLAFGNGSTQATPFLNTTGFVEGVQFNDHFYLVDGDHYVLVHLHDPTHANAVMVWGDDIPQAGPFYTDPVSVTAGCRATIICRWGARIILSGYRDTPNIWYGCAPDAPYVNALSGGHAAGTDGWNSAVVIGAITGTPENEYGTLGDPIIAIFSFAQTGLMFACTNSFSFLTSDPDFDASAQIVSLTKSVGISGRRAWCQSQEKGAFVLANDGLYFINANDFNFNRSNRVSAGRLDSFFLRVDFGTPAIGGTSPLAGGTLRDLVTGDGAATGTLAKTKTPAGALSEEATASEIDLGTGGTTLLGGVANGEVFPCLCYDPDREGVWIFLSVSGAEVASLHLYYDLKGDSFWPQRFADPVCFAPTSGVYIGTSRTNSGRLFLGGSQSISIIDRSFPIGVDGWDSEMSDEAQRRQFMRSSLTIGPIIAQLPYRVMLNEVRIDLADDVYEVPSTFTDLSQSPILSVATGDTAQSALGIQTDNIFAINLNPLVIDGGAADTDYTGLLVYSGGLISEQPQSNTIDGRFAVRPFGLYEQSDPFVAGLDRVYNGPADWIIRWDPLAPVAPAWCIERFTGGSPQYEIEYRQLVPDGVTPDGTMVTITQVPIAPDETDNANVSGASFPESEVTEIGILQAGRNTAKKCRVRSEAMYLTIAADGRPWAIERMSVVISQVGKSRGD